MTSSSSQQNAITSSDATKKIPLGLFYSFITALMWSTLPIALKALLAVMDTMSITWYRFCAAFLSVGGYVFLTKQVPTKESYTKKVLGLLFVASFGLAGNYILYLQGLQLTTPAAAQTVIQLAPLFLLLSSIWIFRDPFTHRQKLGSLILTGGMGLFFHHRLLGLLQSQYILGVALVILAAVVWVVYALAQRFLLRGWSVSVLMAQIYAVGVLLFLPAAHPASIVSLDTLGWGLLAFCAANTVVAYGCFGQAMQHWPAPRVSAVLALTPLLTIFFVYLVNIWVPNFVPTEPMDALNIAGALFVVLGSTITALSKR